MSKEREFDVVVWGSSGFTGSLVSEYLFKNYSRDLKILLSLMDELDIASLQSKKAISIPFVKKHLQL